METITFLSNIPTCLTHLETPSSPRIRELLRGHVTLQRLIQVALRKKVVWFHFSSFLGPLVCDLRLHPNLHPFHFVSYILLSCCFCHILMWMCLHWRRAKACRVPHCVIQMLKGSLHLDDTLKDVTKQPKLMLGEWEKSISPQWCFWTMRAAKLPF